MTTTDLTAYILNNFQLVCFLNDFFFIFVMSFKLMMNVFFLVIRNLKIFD